MRQITMQTIHAQDEAERLHAICEPYRFIFRPISYGSGFKVAALLTTRDQVGDKNSTRFDNRRR